MIWCLNRIRFFSLFKDNEIFFFKKLDLYFLLFLEKDFLLFWTPMTHIITENCIKCKYTDCVTVCPVDCFNEGNNFLVINPELCIDCAICIPECPAEAITSFEDIKNNQKIFIKINMELSKIWPSITKYKLNKNSDNWKNIKNKLHLIKI